DYVNSVIGSVVIAGAGEVAVTTVGQTITISGTDHTEGGGGSVSNALVGADGITVTSGVSEDTITGFRTEFVNASGTLSSEIDSDISTHAAISNAHHSRYTREENDAIIAGSNVTVVSGANTITISSSAGGGGGGTVSDAMVGADGITVISGVPTSSETTISGFQTEFVNASGTLSTQITDDIATHDAITDAHHAKYTDSEAISATESARFTMSGTLSAEIDSDISTHAAIVNAHHDKYTDAEAIAALVPTTDALVASGVADEANLVTISGHLQSEIDAIDSSVTLQEAYDNGDGTITSTTSKPVQTGDLTVTGTVIFQDATTEGSPSFSFAGDPDTGLFHSGSDALKFTTGGTSRFTIANERVLAKVPYVTFRSTGETIPDYTFKGDEDTGMYSG
ncbi:hypothetical protein LCGC14_2856450, partial [marine sediment metagenome]